MVLDSYLETIATAGNRSDQARAVVTDGPPKFADALDQSIISHRDIRPNRCEQLVLGHKPARGLDQVTQHRKGLRPKDDFVSVEQQAASVRIEHVTIETKLSCARALWGRYVASIHCFIGV